MSKSTELYNLRYSFSGDRKIISCSRSGDSNGDGAELWNFVSYIQSAEDNIIEVEEFNERKRARSTFIKLLKLFFKKIFTLQGLRFISAFMRLDKSLYLIGRELGLDYFKTIESIRISYQQNIEQLFLLMRYSGYDCLRGFEFLPKLIKRYNSAKSHRKCQERYLKTHKEQYLKYQNCYYHQHLDKCREIRRCYYKRKKALLTEEQLAVRRAKCREYMRNLRAKQKVIDI